MSTTILCKYKYYSSGKNWPIIICKILWMISQCYQALGSHTEGFKINIGIYYEWNIA